VVVTTYAGSTTSGTTNGVGTNAKFNTPAGVICDTVGNLYVTDSSNRLIRLVDTNAAVTVLAGSGSFGLVDGFGTVAWFGNPLGIRIDSVGRLFVADSQSIRVVEKTGSARVSIVGSILYFSLLYIRLCVDVGRPVEQQ
jgi:sugar lactone lactonase YvrE